MAKESLPTNSITINLSRGQVAIIDADDYERVNQFKWSAQAIFTKSGVRYYAYRTEWLGKQRTPEARQRRILLHRFIMNAPDGVNVDHINREPLDCRKSNMRFATQALNLINRPHRNTSGFRGVSLRSVKQGTRYTAQIRSNRKTRRIGTFDTPEQAARAYDQAAINLWGEFAFLNFPREQYDTSKADNTAGES